MHASPEQDRSAGAYTFAPLVCCYKILCILFEAAAVLQYDAHQSTFLSAV